MDHTAWVNAVLQKLDNAGPDGRAAVAYIAARHVQIGFRKQGEATGAMWWIDGNLYLNPAQYSDATPPDDAYMLSLLAHEALHLRQGLFTALSRYGEFQAWQVGFKILKSLDPAQISPVLEQIMALPFGWERGVIRQAAALMIQYDPGYRINWLPVYPLGQELRYWLTRKMPG
jgi:hypothetical protein